VERRPGGELKQSAKIKKDERVWIQRGGAEEVCGTEQEPEGGKTKSSRGKGTRKGNCEEEERTLQESIRRP